MVYDMLLPVKLTEQTILEFFKTATYHSMALEELCETLHIPSHGKKHLRRLLKRLRREEKIVRTRDRKYRLLNQTDFIVGRVDKHPNGFGFLIPDNPKEEKIYLNRYQMLTLMNEDRLKVLKREGRNKQGQFKATAGMIEVLERGSNKVVGKVVVKGRRAFVIPLKSNSFFGALDNVALPFSKETSQSSGKLVVCRIRDYPKKGFHAKGEITEVLGKSEEKGVHFSAMIHEHDLRHEFPKEVLREAEDIKAKDLKKEIQKRKDLTKLSFITIDGETAKDFDDAVYIEKLSKGHFKLWVAIADVSFFVKENSALDREAYLRATSTYFPGGVIPMFPEVLSNDLCSLNPKEMKLTFCCEMEFNEKGERISDSLYEAVILSHHRMTYTDVQAILEEQEEACQKYPNLVPSISVMNELKEILKNKRLERGCLDFDLPEPELILDLQGNIETVVKRSRLPAHMIIEEFMIAANEAVAEFMFQKTSPFVYRIHEVPEEATLLQFNQLAYNLGFPVRYHKKAHPRMYSDLLKRVEGKPQEKILNTALLRSMRLARYSEENLGHFGLASECYTHFTSPIRRYPDLMIHRLLKEELKKKSKHSDTFDGEVSDKLRIKAEHCSRQERVSEEVEREFIALKKAEFMRDKVGKQFVGYISGMMEFGFFVELETYFIEGLVPLKTLEDDYYQLFREHYLIRGRRTKKAFRLGQKVVVEVSQVNLEKRQIDFSLVESYGHS